MGKLTEETMYENLEFECARCGTKCIKTSALEPEFGYVSVVDGKFTGPLCENCVKEMHSSDIVVKKPLVTAFIIGVQQDGMGVIIKQDGIDVTYMRDATTSDIKAACQEIIDNINSVQLLTKINNILRQAVPQQKSMILPKQR